MMIKSTRDSMEATSDLQARAAWIAPRIVRIEAGSAELEVGASDDGVDKS